MIVRQPSAAARFVDQLHHNAAITTGAVLKKLEQYDECTRKLEGITSSFDWNELRRVSHLGQGTYSNVYHVVTEATGDQFALKCLDPQKIESSKDFLDAAVDLANEADVLSKLDHVNIIRLRGVSGICFSQSYSCCYSSLTNNFGYFILLDMIEETLEKRIQRWKKNAVCHNDSIHYSLLRKMTKRKRRSPFCFKRKNKRSNSNLKGENMIMKHKETIFRIETVALAVAQGMAYLHEQGIILRDLKPTNIGFDLVTGCVKIFDFGMSQKESSRIGSTETKIRQGSISRRSINSGTSQGGEVWWEGEDVVCGTVRYMAPEVMVGGIATKTSDVYSFGVVLYEVCCLEKLFSNETGLERFKQRIMSGERPTGRIIPCQYTRDLISNCWSSNPSNRPSFDGACKRLKEIILLGDDVETSLVGERDCGGYHNLLTFFR